MPALAEQVSVTDDTRGGKQRKEPHGNSDRIDPVLAGQRPSFSPDAQPNPSDAPITMREMMEAGVHFGHQTKRWNPKMKQSSSAPATASTSSTCSRRCVRSAAPSTSWSDTSRAASSVLFVGTKKQAQDVMREEALRAGQFYVTNRWLGGTLTNFQHRQGLDRPPARHREDGEDGTFER